MNTILTNIITGSMVFSSHVLIAGVKSTEGVGPSFKKLNFGVLVNNGTYQIYRSQKLGKNGLKTLEKYLIDKKLPFPKTIIYMNKNGYKFPFYFANEEFLQKDKYGFQFYHAYGEGRTYLDGQNPYYPSEDIDTRHNLGSTARKLFTLENNGIDGGVEKLLEILNLVLDPANQPVLFHCHGGMHRTGIVALALRYIQGGFWTNGPLTHKRGMDLNPAQLEYLRFNPILFRKENLQFMEEFAKDRDFLYLKERYTEQLGTSLNGSMDQILSLEDDIIITDDDKQLAQEVEQAEAVISKDEDQPVSTQIDPQDF